jgi:5'-nucleotidase / UDP-sugar diphosphatase
MDMKPMNFNAGNNVELSHALNSNNIRPDGEEVELRAPERKDSVAVGRAQGTMKSFSPDALKNFSSAAESPVESARPPADSPPDTRSSDETTTITLISTNDMHGQFKNMPQVSGVVHQLKKENPDAVVVDVGDISYNPPYSDNNHFDPMIDIMNQIGYNIVEPGNHEFQYGAPTMHDEYTTRIKADVICSNVKDPRTNDYLPGIKPYVIKEIDGVKVAFIGTVVPDMATSAHPNVGKDVKRLDINDTVRSLLPEIKAQGADVIVDLSHHGIGKKADVDLAKNVDGIDVILSGHDHQLTETPIVIPSSPSQTYVIEGMSHGKFVMKTDIEVDKKTHHVISVTMKPYPTSTSTVKPDPVVQDILHNYQDKGGGNSGH